MILPYVMVIYKYICSISCLYYRYLKNASNETYYNISLWQKGDGTKSRKFLLSELFLGGFFFFNEFHSKPCLAVFFNCFYGLYFFFFLRFIHLFNRERGSTGVCKQVKQQAKGEGQIGPPLSRKPNVGVDLKIQRSWPEPTA